MFGVAMTTVSEDTKRARCAEVASTVARLNPHLDVRFNESAVFLVHDRGVTMIFSWTITGHFLVCRPMLDVTALVKPDTLDRATATMDN